MAIVSVAISIIVGIWHYCAAVPLIYTPQRAADWRYSTGQMAFVAIQKSQTRRQMLSGTDIFSSMDFAKKPTAGPKTVNPRKAFVIPRKGIGVFLCYYIQSSESRNLIPPVFFLINTMSLAHGEIEGWNSPKD